MNRILIDTSLLIEHLRIKNKSNSRYALLLEKYNPVVSFIVVTELYSGKSAQKEIHRKEIDNILIGTEMELPDVELAGWAGDIRSKFDLSVSDAFIAASAIKLNLPLATLDKRDFSRIKGLKLHKLT